MGKQPTDAPVSIRRGTGHGTLAKVLRVIGGGPFRSEVATPNAGEAGRPGGRRTGSYERRGRVMPVEQRALTSGVLSKEQRIGDW